MLVELNEVMVVLLELAASSSSLTCPGINDPGGGCTSIGDPLRFEESWLMKLRRPLPGTVSEERDSRLLGNGWEQIPLGTPGMGLGVRDREEFDGSGISIPYCMEQSDRSKLRERGPSFSMSAQGIMTPPVDPRLRIDFLDVLDPA